MLYPFSSCTPLEYPDLSTLRDIFPCKFLSHIRNVYLNYGRSLQRSVHILSAERDDNNNDIESESDTTTENLPVLRGKNMTFNHYLT